VSKDAQRAVALLRTRWQQFSDLRALIDVRVARGKDKQQFMGVLLLKAPAAFRLEALSPLGQPMMLATIYDGQLTVYDVAAHSATVGPATPQMAAQLIHLAVDPPDLVGLFAGHAVPPRDLRTAEIVPADQDGPSLEMIGPIHRQRVWMDFETGVVRQIQIAGGRVDALVTYERAGDGSLTGFDLTAAQGNVTGRVRYRNLVVGAGVDSARFYLAIPSGATIERLR
jgi:outer membrane lipoprotein-sorting protein